MNEAFQEYTDRIQELIFVISNNNVANKTRREYIGKLIDLSCTLYTILAKESVNAR